MYDGSHVPKSTALSLRGLKLERLPPKLFELTWLFELDLADNELTLLPDSFARLTALGRLNLAGNRLASLPEWLGDFVALSRLDVSGNALTGLPYSIGNLTGLRTLDASGNAIVSLPESVGKLVRLTHLDLSHNALTSLPSTIGSMAWLSQLDLEDNALTSLPDSVGGLTALRKLDLSGNALTVLPGELGRPRQLSELHFRGNPLVSPPPEVAGSGARAVLAFLRGLSQGTEQQWASKMLVVGEAAVGKTSVTKALCDLPYDAEESQTHGVHLDVLTLAHPHSADTNMRLNVWDFGGQLEYRATQRFYLTDRSLFLLVWNTRRGWRTGGQVEAWLEAITNAAPASPILIVGTHCGESVADLDEGDIFRRYPNVADILRVDCKDGTGVAELRDRVSQQAATLPLMGASWPSAWARGADHLTGQPGWYITARQAAALLSKHGLKDETARTSLIAALHDRGEVLHFANHPELRDRVVLQPAWIEAMITRVLDSQQVADRGGVLSRAHRAELWHDLDDPGLAEMLTALMERFDLAYRIDSPDHEDVALVVERLPAGVPQRLPPEWDQALAAPGASELRITYKLPSRQAGVPSWFIAREHRFTTGVAWARGVLLRHHGAGFDAWALLHDDDRAEPTVRLTVRGTMPHVFYSLLTEAFTGILAERYPGLQVRQLVPCCCATSAQPPPPVHTNST